MPSTGSKAAPGGWRAPTRKGAPRGGRGAAQRPGGGAGRGGGAAGRGARGLAVKQDEETLPHRRGLVEALAQTPARGAARGLGRIDRVLRKNVLKNVAHGLPDRHPSRAAGGSAPRDHFFVRAAARAPLAPTDRKTRAVANRAGGICKIRLFSI